MPKHAIVILLLCGTCACASGGHRGRDLTVRGFRIATSPQSSLPEQAHGWDLVAQGLAVYLSLPGHWTRQEPFFSGDIRSFLTECAKAAGVPGKYFTNSNFEGNHGKLQCRAERDIWGRCDAVALTIGRRVDGPAPPAAGILIGKTSSGLIAGGWLEQVGCPPPADQYEWPYGDLAVWRSGNNMWAVLAGARTGGGSGFWPSATVMRTNGGHWRRVRQIDIGEDGGIDKCEFGVRDLDGDVIPEIIGNIHTMAGQGHRRSADHYLVYKLIRGQYRKVWYAKIKADTRGQ
jgi:hypothetical protein